MGGKIEIMIKKSFIFLPLLIFLFLSMCFVSANAMLFPQVYFTDLNLEKTNFNPGDTITGTASLWNYEQFVVSDLVFNFQLLGDKIDGVPTTMIDDEMNSNVFSLSPGEKTSKSFSYTIPSNLPVSSLVFRIQLSNSRGEEMGWKDQDIIIGGEDKFLILNNYWIVKDGVDLSPGAGVDYQPNEIPQISFDVTNNSSFTITAFPKITTYKRNVGQFLQEDKKDSIVLAPGEKRTIETTLPKFINPESYLSEIKLYDTENEELISSSIYFRWIISGQDDAEILFVNPDQDSYDIGEEVVMDIQITGPAHTYLDEVPLIEAEEGTVEFSIFNQDNELVCQGSKEVTLEGSQISVGCVALMDVVNPKIETKIVKNDKILDNYEFEVESKDVVLEKGVEKEKVGFFKKNEKTIFFVLIGLVLIIMIMMTIFYFKGGKKILSVLIPLILLGFGMLFGVNSVLAATEVTGGLCDTTIVFNSPIPNQEYESGDTINFTGKFRVTSCGDGLFFNKITFFITEDKEIPLITTNACSNCLGASSTVYPQSVCNCGWCNQVQVLQENNPNFKVHKLGTIYPHDVSSGARPYWVEYGQDFVIPDNLEFSGPVRFYVQYSGTHWSSHWHWNITYQPGTVIINKPPTASNLIITESSPTTYCANPAHYFSWDYLDFDGDSESKYEFQIDNNSDFNSLVINRTINNPTIDNQTVSVAISSAADKLIYNTTYHWRVKVYDSNGADSGWMSGSDFTTEAHQYPLIDFNWLPSIPSQYEEVVFNDDSIVYGGSSKSAWSWIFTGGNPAISSQQNPIIQFNSTEGNQVTLQVTDSDGYSCSVSKTINVQSELPGWLEN